MPKISDLITNTTRDRVIAAILKSGDVSGEIYTLPGAAPRWFRCEKCGGEGEVPGVTRPVPTGNRMHPIKQVQQYEECDVCGGGGEVNEACAREQGWLD